MFELKPISTAAIPRAVAKAERYRLLNEPQEAESICRDVLRVDAAGAGDWHGWIAWTGQAYAWVQDSN